jgi:hypothetical protein
MFGVNKFMSGYEVTPDAEKVTPVVTIPELPLPTGYSVTSDELKLQLQRLKEIFDVNLY